MAFVITLGFTTEQAKDDFIERTLPKVRGQQVDAPEQKDAEENSLHRIGVAVTSQSAAKDVCHLLASFLSHSKNARVNVSWTGTDGQPQSGDVNSEAARDADLLAMRLGAAAKAHIDSEKAAAEKA